ncbi:SMP-30/gluconolactonase/LRE family protein [Novosphingobium sp.]|uniref:SMP-30/gluconolactonase/LRE family protein n=1 Tax=Novosphingobium sp. TaxID=1874826 RepID=UPI003BAB5151
MQITKLDVPRCLVGEGPVWDVGLGLLFWIDILGRKVHNLDPATGATRAWEVPGVIGSMALRESGGAIVALANGVHALDLDTGDCTLIASSPDLDDQVQLADGKVDRRGRFIVGSSDRSMKDARGKLYVLEPGAAQLRVIDEGMTLSNGPCWSPDNATFYHADSIRNEIYAYDYDIETAAVLNRRLFASTAELGGIPDGATVDALGGVWSAICEGGKLVRFLPDGSVDRIIDMPVRLPGSVMFGGAALDRLFVPSLDPSFMGRANDPLDGETFVIDGLGFTGLPEPRFTG